MVLGMADITYYRRLCQALDVMPAYYLVVKEVKDHNQRHRDQQAQHHCNKIVLHGAWLDLGTVV